MTFASSWKRNRLSNLLANLFRKAHCHSIRSWVSLPYSHLKPEKTNVSRKTCLLVQAKTNVETLVHALEAITGIDIWKRLVL